MGASVEITKNVFAQKGVDAGNKQGILETCILLNTQAETLVPVDLGQLKNTLMYKVEEQTGGFNNSADEKAPSNQEIAVPARKQKSKIVGYQGTNSDHWYPEFGTRFQAAQPFERPAKEIVIDGGQSKYVMIKYSKSMMQREFLRRKIERKKLNG